MKKALSLMAAIVLMAMVVSACTRADADVVTELLEVHQASGELNAKAAKNFLQIYWQADENLKENLLPLVYYTFYSYTVSEGMSMYSNGGAGGIDKDSLRLSLLAHAFVEGAVLSKWEDYLNGKVSGDEFAEYVSGVLEAGEGAKNDARNSLP